MVTLNYGSYSSMVPAVATAQCVDGAYSFSQSRSGTCSHHGGGTVAINFGLPASGHVVLVIKVGGNAMITIGGN